MNRSLTLALAVLLCGVTTAAMSEELPIPESLESPVAFWTRVYTEVDSRSGLIHDSRHLDVVYETMRFPKGISHRSREKRTEKAKKRITATLKKLASGERENLSAAEKAVLAQWPSDVTNATLRDAARRVRFQLGQADRFREGLVRAGAWRSHVEERLAARGVPADLVALPHVESSYNPKAYSRIGAAGMWQFTRSTGRLFLRIDSVVDERLDPFVATDAAARLLKKNHDLTGTWPLAITSYNHGAGGMRRAARKLGTVDMGEIALRYRSRTFGFASRNFYASFKAASQVDRDPTRYFGTLHPNQPIEYHEVELPWFTPAKTLARALGVDLGTLKEHNPGLRPAVWNGTKHLPRHVTLRIPKEKLADPADTLIAAVPADKRFGRQHRDRFHKVRRGETLSKIARRYGLRQSELVAVNNLRSRHRIRVGQVLVLPGSSGGGGNVVVAAQEPLPSSGVYRVQPGDSLGKIAARFGVTEHSLARENDIRNRHRIRVGQRLRVPGASSSSTVLASATQEQMAVKASPASVQSASPDEAAASKASARAETPKPKAAAAPKEKPQAKAKAKPAPRPAPPPKTDPLPVSDPPLTEAPAPAAAPAPPLPRRGGQPDPSDYTVHGDRITVQAAETLGHYAEWLEVRASRLRQINGMRFEQPVVIGARLKLDFSGVDAAEFENRRLEYHQSLQNEFFEAYVVTGTERHSLARGESLWYLARRKYRVPVWLLRQYNPDLDFAALPAGAPLMVPVVEPREG